MESKEMKMISSLLIGLFLVLVITGVIFIGSSYMKDLACTQESDTFVWEGGACLNATGGTEQTVDSLTAIETVEAGINVALGLIGLIILITIFAVVIKTAVGFNKGMN